VQNSSDDDDDDSKNNFILNKITENDDYDFSTNDDFINDFAAFLNFFTSENVTNSFADFLNISANVIKNSFADFFDFLTNEDARIFDSKIDETNERNKI
jgi:predicted transcriptional regulator